jgi:hypothetical protein
VFTPIHHERVTPRHRIDIAFDAARVAYMSTMDDDHCTERLGAPTQSRSATFTQIAPSRTPESFHVCALIAVASFAGCGDDSPRMTVSHASSSQIDERAGTFRGVGLGHSPREIAEALGRPRETVVPGAERHWIPLGYGDQYDLGLPGLVPPANVGPAPTFTGQLYRGAAFISISRFGSNCQMLWIAA